MNMELVDKNDRNNKIRIIRLKGRIFLIYFTFIKKEEALFD
ncbi:MAG TPA: hypothetical protein VIP70_00800 [Nitrososphaeraceae archaeon]